MNELSPEPQDQEKTAFCLTPVDELDNPIDSTEVDKTVRKRRRRKRTNWMFTGTLLCFCAAYLFYVLAVPEIAIVIQRWRFPKKPPDLAMKWWDRNVLKTCEFLFVTWFFYLGASIGSFLNVVAWRMPEGRTIVFGGSKCPFCDTRLSFIDNTPVIGWLLLQGRCRTCRLPIAPRYLLIEIAVGLAFVWIALWQLIRGGANLPNWRVEAHVGLVATVFDPNWPLIGASFSHACMFAVLIMLATANTGRKPFPLFPVFVMTLAICSAKLFNTSLDFVRWSAPFSIGLPKNIDPFIDPVLSILIGGLIGGSLGWLSSFSVVRNEGPIVRWHWMLQSLLIGAVLGWQSVATILLISVLLRGAIGLLGAFRAKVGENASTVHPASNSAMLPSLCLIGACIVHHSFWRQIAHLLGMV